MAIPANAIVVVFTIPGCQACEEFKPRFARVAQAYMNYVPIWYLNANDTNPEVADFVSRLNVQNVPATFVLRRPTGMMKVEGGIPDSQIAWLLGIAAREAATKH